LPIATVYPLNYLFQRKPTDERAARRTDIIQEKLSWEPGILNGKGWKLKGMHWHTFKQSAAHYTAFFAESLSGIARLFGMSPPDWECIGP
jgi:hypothetical protein